MMTSSDPLLLSGRSSKMEGADPSCLTLANHPSQHTHTGDCAGPVWVPCPRAPISPGSEPCQSGPVPVASPGTWRPLPALVPSEQCPLSHCTLKSLGVYDSWGLLLQCYLGIFIPAEGHREPGERGVTE